MEDLLNPMIYGQEANLQISSSDLEKLKILKYYMHRVGLQGFDTLKKTLNEALEMIKSYDPSSKILKKEQKAIANDY